MKNILRILFMGAIMFPFVTYGQSAADKKVQAGLTFNAGANFLSPSSNKIEVNGGGSVLSIGLNLHSALKSSQNFQTFRGGFTRIRLLITEHELLKKIEQNHRKS